MHTDEDVTKLIAAALECEPYFGAMTARAKDNLTYALKPFREQRPRVGKMLVEYRPLPENAIEVDAVELTDAVRERLSGAGGVRRIDIQNNIASGEQLSTRTDAIMRLIEDAGVDYD